VTDETDHNLWGTPSVVVDECIYQLDRDGFFEGDRNEFYLEPSAGAGAWTAGLLRLDISPQQIKAIDRLGWLCEIHKEQTSVRCLQISFLEWAKTQPVGKYVGIGNPPFGSGIELQFVEALKRVCSRFALILPIGMLEPAKNRPDGLYDNLKTIYPLRRIKFVNMATGATKGQKAGSRPVALMVFDMEHPTPTRLSYSIQRGLDKQGMEGAD